jgi:hypothetical protein
MAHLALCFNYRELFISTNESGLLVMALFIIVPLPAPWNRRFIISPAERPLQIHSCPVLTSIPHVNAMPLTAQAPPDALMH